MNVELKVGMRGFYKLDVFKADGTFVRGTDWFANLITDSGKNLIAKQDYLAFCHCGTGTTSPSTGDTTLNAFVAATSVTVGGSSGATATPPYYAYKTKVYQFSAGAAAGNIAEVGISFTASSSGPLFSRALVLDGGGSPTTITVLSDELLQVTYQLRLYPPTTDVTGSVTIGGTSYATTLRAANVTAWSAGTDGTGGIGSSPSTCVDYSGTIGGITSTPGGSVIDASVGVANVAAYVDGNFYQDIVLTHPINNPGTLQSFHVTCKLGQWQFQISPTLTILFTQQLQIVLRISWDRGSESP